MPHGALKALARGLCPALLLVASQAMAADLTSPASSANWTGFYLGANLGGAFGTTRQSEITNPSTTGDFDVSGLIGGVTVGYNAQFDKFVLGAEADMDWNGADGSHPCPNNGAPTGFQCSTRNNYLGTVRLRAGYAIDNLLLYGTGGLAFGDIDQKFSPPYPPAPGPSYSGGSSDRTGYAVGVGAEYAFAHGWSVKAEYLYADLGTFTCGIDCTGVPGEIAKIKLDENVVRIGLNYHF